jgi:hypothetical protein
MIILNVLLNAGLRGKAWSAERSENDGFVEADVIEPGTMFLAAKANPTTSWSARVCSCQVQGFIVLRSRSKGTERLAHCNAKQVHVALSYMQTLAMTR